MLTFDDLVTEFLRYTGAESGSVDETMGKDLLNRGITKLVAAGSLTFPEKEHSITLTASTFKYDLPPFYGKLKEAIFIDGTDQHPPMEQVDSWDQWYRLRANGSESTPTHIWMVKDDTGATAWQAWFYPTPDAAKTVKLVFNRRVPRLSVADYTTGSITATNGDATITGAGTTFTSAMVGRSIELPDGYWYDIETFTSTTSIEINQPYPSTTEGGATFAIGEVPIIPEEFQDAIWQFAVGTWWKKRRQYQDSAFYLGLYEDAKNELQSEHQSKTESAVIEDEGAYENRHVNDYPNDV